MNTLLEHSPKSNFDSLKFLLSKRHYNIEGMILNSKTL